MASTSAIFLPVVSRPPRACYKAEAATFSEGTHQARGRHSRQCNTIVLDNDLAVGPWSSAILGRRPAQPNAVWFFEMWSASHIVWFHQRQAWNKSRSMWWFRLFSLYHTEALWQYRLGREMSCSLIDAGENALSQLAATPL